MNTMNFKIGTKNSSVIFKSGLDLVYDGKNDNSLYIYDNITKGLFLRKEASSVVLKKGEENKSWDSIRTILDSALENGLGRDNVFVGIGGGVICDMAAFAASIYMRGVGIILVPTTLLAMIDASLGGKTGIDYLGYKNIVGTFYPAEKILIFPEVLRTLSNSEFLNGLGEVIKHALLVGDDALFTLLLKEKKKILSRDPDILNEIIRLSLLIKGKVVEEDPEEKGTRAFLNFGHTFAHGLESAAGFKDWSHGSAVAWGIDKALKTGEAMGFTPPDYVQQVEFLLTHYGFKLSAPMVPVDKIINCMKTDKKKQKGKVRFVLQKNLGETFLTPVDDDTLRFILQK